MTVLLVHGAGSSSDAAVAIVGPLLAGRHIVTIDDRSGEIDDIVSAIEQAADSADDVTHVVGISLGAHAVALWASRRSVSSIVLVLLLPAWLGPPDATSQLTAAAAEEIRRQGIAATLTRISAESELPDVAALLEQAWSHYSDAQLAVALERASHQRAPADIDLERLVAPACVIGWEGDHLHPACMARRWGTLIPHARVAVAARPSVALLRAAVAAATGWSRPPRPPDAEGT